MTDINNLKWMLDYEISQSTRYRRFLSLVMLSSDWDSEKFHRILEGMLRSSDVFFTINGSFAVLMGETDMAEALNAVERYQRVISGAMDVQYSVATFPDDAKSTSELIDIAYRRLKTAHELDSGAVVTMVTKGLFLQNKTKPGIE
ncbi:MAG: hypothetical protein H8D67_12515 [Deltaproteobacteria bacterium]|nr:hypothetical protein [Deltaproteobacteria bacterium]MBL7204709.1 hypothetical protein [Desulfobacteraceae bacterium]